MNAEAFGRIDVEYGEHRSEGATQRNGHEIRVGAMEFQIPKSREGTYFPAYSGWL